MDLTLSFKEYFLRMNRNMVTIEDFAQYLSNFQKIINILAQEKRFDKNLNDFRFLIKTIRFDSCDCVIESYGGSKGLEGLDLVREVIDEFEEVSELIKGYEIEHTFQELKNKIKKQENRISLYNCFDKLIPKENNAFQIYIKDKKDPATRKIFTSKYRFKKGIEAWRKLDKKPQIETKTFIGVIKSLNAYNKNKKFVKIIDDNGVKVQYFYDDDEREKITNLYDRDIIKISGEYNPYQKTISKLTVFKKVTEIKLFKLKDVQFKHSIILKLEYEYNSIYASNKEFGLYAFGSTINETLKDIYTRIDHMIDFYSNPHMKFTKASEAYRKNFLETFSKKTS